jgi:UbiA prenyltransferase family
VGYSGFIRRTLLDLIRADEWWQHKLVPTLSAFYATALVLRVGVHTLWAGALTLSLAIATAAIFASAINELTDRNDDAAAGKRNRAAERPRSVAALLGVSVSAAFVLTWLWRDDLLLVSCYAAIFVAFALYSTPPFRLKKRGFAGVLCDAAGEQMLPSLVAVFAACRSAHRAAGDAWLVSVGIWALAFGLRGIVWHQLTDVENDRAAGTATFARRSPRRAAWVGAFLVFPLELSALAAMLWQIRSPWPEAFLVAYALYAIGSVRRGQTSAVIVAPKSRGFIVLHEFYTELFPVALLVAASVRDRRDLVVMAVHVVLFPPRHVLRVAQRSATSSRRVNASTASTVVNASEPHHGGLG